MCQARTVECNELKEPSTREITTVGLDIAKRVVQLHGVDAAGEAVLRRKLQRSELLSFFKGLPPCLVGIEACGTAHYWAHEIRTWGAKSRSTMTPPPKRPTALIPLQSH
jgi:transposase